MHYDVQMVLRGATMSYEVPRSTTRYYGVLRPEAARLRKPAWRRRLLAACVHFGQGCSASHLPSVEDEVKPVAADNFPPPPSTTAHCYTRRTAKQQERFEKQTTIISMIDARRGARMQRKGLSVFGMMIRSMKQANGKRADDDYGEHM